MNRDDSSLLVEDGATGSVIGGGMGFGLRLGGGVQSVAVADSVAVSVVSSGNGMID